MEYYTLVLFAALLPVVAATGFLNKDWNMTDKDDFTLRYDGCEDMSPCPIVLYNWSSWGFYHPVNDTNAVQTVMDDAGYGRNSIIDMRLDSVPSGDYFLLIGNSASGRWTSDMISFEAFEKPLIPMPKYADVRIVSVSRGTNTTSGATRSATGSGVASTTQTASATANNPSSTARASSSPAAAAAVTTAPPTSTATPDQQQQQNPPQLSTGAKAGIGVGCAAAVLTALALAALLWRRRRRRQRRGSGGAGRRATSYIQPGTSPVGFAQPVAVGQHGLGGQELYGLHESRAASMQQLGYGFGLAALTDRSGANTPLQQHLSRQSGTSTPVQQQRHLSYQSGTNTPVQQQQQPQHLSYQPAQPRNQVLEMYAPGGDAAGSSTTMAASAAQSTPVTSRPSAGANDKSSTTETDPALAEFTLGPTKRVSAIDMPWLTHEENQQEQQQLEA
ncbi:hypothetical protein JDV02_002829 [Purpureocillium takamizusanense]|uniref:Mid2 domain-containing protein n=1 Tax=Purpureocillium takamizusanense TaxID=2060973 RepID=A0A9Q8QCB9_9HYPO|nr:uncharacterized protein JDV02_002829 [Purpureocillium takamizusanense]UNI16394.1 hypothetical protein JDV02_002829 [Purpureocillium takamizusanense]